MELGILPGHTDTADHWHWRPGWRLGRRMYTMHLTLHEAPAAEAAIGRMQELVAPVDILRPVLIAGLHLTMTGVGFTDEVTAGQLEEVMQRVFSRAEAISTTPLVLDSMLVGTEAVMLLAQQEPWLDELLASQREAVDAVLGPHEWGPFHPHVSIAYSDGVTAIDDAYEGLAGDVARLDPVVIDKPTLTLMRLGRDRRVYEWDVVREHALGS